MTELNIARWLHFMLVPFSLFGFSLVVLGLLSDQNSPVAERARFWLRAVTVTWSLALLLGTGVFAAAVYDICTDPQYVNTWWYYAWGCYLR
jgi:hypothetical protein